MTIIQNWIIEGTKILAVSYLTSAGYQMLRYSLGRILTCEGDSSVGRHLTINVNVSHLI